MAQVEDDRLGDAVADGRYIDATRAVLRERGGLWFFDEVLRDLAPARLSLFVFLPRYGGGGERSATEGASMQRGASRAPSTALRAPSRCAALRGGG